MLHESSSIIPRSKRPRTQSVPTRDLNPPTRPFSRETSMVQDPRQESHGDRIRPGAGVQYHEFEAIKPKSEIAQASGVPHYLVPFRWFEAFIRYARDGTGQEPADLDLIELDNLKDGEHLRPDLKLGRDIQILQTEQWSKIQEWYGSEDEYVVRHSYKVGEGQYMIEWRPTDFYFSLYTPPSSFTELKKISMYKYKDIEGLYEKARHAFSINPSQHIRFWHTSGSAGLTNLNTAKEAIAKTYDRVNIGTVTDGSTSFIVETKQNASEKWPLEVCKTAQIARGRPAGTKGLNNLGNTCYMASALQCLTHVKELCEYFLSDCYQTELNSDNPLGYDGRVATAFARLLAQLYAQDQQKTVAPRELKTVLGNINQSFGGYQQQDSQELLAFLLDALHEDLNRIVKKPATERPDIGDVNEAELLRLGEEAWRIHKLRNDSVIVDLFQGIYKSTLVCPVCSHVSITFDPFSDLSLPLPFRSYWTHDIYFVPQVGRIVKINLDFDQNSSVGQIISYLAKRFGIPPNKIAGAEVWKHRFYKLYENYMPVTSIEKSDEAYFYELDAPDPRTDKESEVIMIPVYTNRRARRSEKADECGVPFPIILNHEEAKDYNAIQRKLLLNYTRFTTSEDLVNGGNLTQNPSSDHENVAEDMRMDQEDDILEPPKPIHVSTTPFHIKVGPHRIGANFYGGRDPVPLSDRIPRPAPKLPERLNSSHAPTHELSEMQSDPDGTALTNTSDNIVEDTDPIRDQSYSSSANSNVAEDLGMKDDSDDDLIASSGQGKELVSRLLRSQVPAESPEPVDAMMSPTSAPGSPISEADPTLENTVLLSEKDALFCEWPELVYTEIFSEDAGSIGGRAKWYEYDIQTDTAMESQRAAREGGNSNIKSLDDCLDEFAKEEPLDAENTWYCPKCKEHQRANKTFELWRSGDILVFHLKRFSNSRSLSDKIDAEIQFPVRGLDLNERLGERRLKIEQGQTVTEDSIYDLTGVVNHYGGLGGGHYTAFAQTFDTEGYHDFHNFNDSSVNPMETSNIVSSSAYLLFYRRRSSRPLGGDLDSRVRAYAEKQKSLKQDDLGLAQTVSMDSIRDTSLPSYNSSTSVSSPATSVSEEGKAEQYVPFVGPGRPLGGLLGENYNGPTAASNPFNGPSWGSHVQKRFATTDSETSDRADTMFSEQDHVSGPQSDGSASWSQSEQS